MSSSLAYRPEVDGLRALAVVPVVLFHAGFSGFSGGYIGVDIFFVISGYIITTTAFRSKSALEFAWKRFRRVAPLYYLLSIPWLLIALYYGENYKRALVVTFTFWPAIGMPLLSSRHTTP